MVSKRRHSPWFWIPCLCAAEEIPFAVVTYVALLMFLQCGASETMAAVYGGLLFLPLLLKSFFYNWARKTGVKWRIYVVEFLVFFCLMQTAFYLSENAVERWALFVHLFVLSILCAWHELYSRLYYHSMLQPREQHIFRSTKMAASLVALMLTYGLLIIVVGFFEVFFRNYQKAWAMESALVAGVFLLVCVLNIIVLRPPYRMHMRHLQQSPGEELLCQHEGHIFGRIRRSPRVLGVLACLFLLLLPQSLMFHVRVFFLMSPVEDGGLGCSVQEVGFAQGTIGVLAFSVGLIIGRYLAIVKGQDHLFWPASVVLTLSPGLYMLMALNPQPNNLFMLCCMTFLAQLFFGFGLNACMMFISYLSGNRYGSIVNYIHVPMVAGLMLVPIMLSGWLVTKLGYSDYFFFSTLLAPVAWVVLAVDRTKEKINNVFITS